MNGQVGRGREGSGTAEWEGGIPQPASRPRGHGCLQEGLSAEIGMGTRGAVIPADATSGTMGAIWKSIGCKLHRESAEIKNTVWEVPGRYPWGPERSSES